ncbi:MAG: hypothetical protein E7639_06005 [Ruminococcaceae bacterium]|nr:hypothetical protein [Oscillospiraceae bacterium]
MKKKIVCLVLALLMVLPLLVGCSQNKDIDDINKEASRYTTTLNVWLITESKLVADASALINAGLTPNTKAEDLTEAQKTTLAAMSEEQLSAWNQVYRISEAINKLSKAKYKTKLNLKFFLESDYYTAVEAAFEEHYENIKAGNVAVKNETEETILNEYGIPELKYPTVADYEVDLLYIGDYGKYATYAANDWLINLRTHLENAAVKLTSYVSLSYLTSAALNSNVYALPNNHGVGEYVYVMADKELMAEYSNDLSDAALYDSAFKEYLDYISGKYTGSNKIYPIYTDNQSGKIDLDFAHYWSYDFDSAPGFALQTPDNFSIFGDSYANKASLGNNNLLTDTAYMTALANKSYYEKTAGYVTTDPDARAAVRVVRGGYEMKAQYEAEGYEVMVMQYPELSDAEIYSSLFAVGAYSVNAERSAEILTFFNTDAEVRNLLQYGIVEENYTLETVTVDGKDYVWAKATKDNLYEMDVDKTGNVFLTYPSSAADVKRWEYEKAQNLEMVTYPTLGLNYDAGDNLDEKNVRIINAISAAMAAELADMSPDEIMALYHLAGGLSTNTDMANLILGIVGANITYTMGGTTTTIDASALSAAIKLMKTTEIKSGEARSPFALYSEWLKAQEF